MARIPTVAEIVRGMRKHAARPLAELAKKHKEKNFVQRSERAALRAQLRRDGASKHRIEEECFALEIRHRRERRETKIAALAAQDVEIKQYRAEVRRQLGDATAWFPRWPCAAHALGDKRSVKWWDDAVSRISDAMLLQWLQLSHRPQIKRPAPCADLPVGLPDYHELMDLTSVQHRVKQILESRDHLLRKRLRMALVPAAPGQPKSRIDESSLAAARRCRDSIKRQLHVARREAVSNYTYRVAAREVIKAAHSDCSPALLGVVGNLKPSEAAYRVAAQKFGLPVSRVRSGKAEPMPVPPRQRRRRTVQNVEDVEAIERGREGNLRGRPRTDLDRY